MIRVVLGALAEQRVDAVIRPVRSDHAPTTAAGREVIARAGPSVEEHLRASGPLPVGSAILTTGGALPTEFLIHAVVMSDEEPETPQTLRRALMNGLGRAGDWDLERVALPPFGLGAGNLDPERAARDLIEMLEAHLAAGRPPTVLVIVAGSPFESELLQGMLDQRHGR